MKIEKLVIFPSNQFDLMELDFTKLEKVCFIGENGTGKSTILKTIFNVLDNPFNQREFDVSFPDFLLSFQIEDIKLYTFYKKDYNRSYLMLHNEISENDFYSNYIDLGDSLREKFENAHNRTNQSLKNMRENYIKNEIYILIYSPAESNNNQFFTSDFNNLTNLNNALSLFKNFPKKHIISYDNLIHFWNLIIYQVKKREDDRDKYETNEENINKTKKQLIEEFDKLNPDFLKILAEEWNIILKKAGLYFDYDNARKPIQLNDNLQAYIKSINTDIQLNYNVLSTGIRHLIFRSGYLLSLYYNRKIDSGVALFDEPENSLFPNLLFEIVDNYVRITKNTQFFFATHSPIIAAQFKPEERFILKFNENAKVEVSKGISPTGDDPNDLLTKDFGIESLLGKEGYKNFERYIELKTLIRNEINEQKREEYVKEFTNIGKEYSF